MSLRRRLEKLESRTEGPAPFEIVGMGEVMTEAELDRAEAEARERLGPNARIIRVRYVKGGGPDEWEGDNGESGNASE